MRLCFFEDSGVLFLEPLALTRPAFDLRCGASTLLQRQCRVQQADEVGALIRRPLADVCRLQHPALICNDARWCAQPDTVFINARWFPPATALGELNVPRMGMVGSEVAYIVGSPVPPPAGDLPALDAWLGACKDVLPAWDAGGEVFDFLWEIVDHNAAALSQDWQWFRAHHSLEGIPAGVAVNGPADAFVVAEGALVEPFVYADTRGGPVLIDRGAVVQSFSRLEGPCYIGRDTHVLGAKIRAGTSLGPQCRVGGEIEASIVLGHSNKYHDGFLGHSYLGEWVNLGAGTHTSDLRNDYGAVKTTVASQRLSTGRSKVGSFLGDHTKTGLGTLFNTGSVVGAFCNVLPSGSLLPQVIPPFVQVRDGQFQERWDLRQLFNTAATVLRRRGQELTQAHRELYLWLYEHTDTTRRTTMRDAEARRMRQSI